MDNNQLPEVNNEVKEEKQITPVSEVEIIEDKEITDTSKPDKKSNLSTVLLILLFIAFFIYIMGMPYINSYINKLTTSNSLSEIEKEAKLEEEKQNQQQSTPVVDDEEETLKETVCTSSINNLENYQLVEIQKFEVNENNQIINSSITSNYTFTVNDDLYNSLKNECEENGLKYINYDGYGRACSYDDTNVEITHIFELETFKPIEDQNISIQANATYKQNIDEVKNILISKGYVCE